MLLWVLVRLGYGADGRYTWMCECRKKYGTHERPDSARGNAVLVHLTKKPCTFQYKALSIYVAMAEATFAPYPLDCTIIEQSDSS